MPKSTSPEAVITEAIEHLAALAREKGNTPCVRCTTPMFFLEAPCAVKPGHVYSDAGRREVSITGLCEWCFDEVTVEREDCDVHGPDQKVVRCDESTGFTGGYVYITTLECGCQHIDDSDDGLDNVR